jgi:hypothetical protein
MREEEENLVVDETETIATYPEKEDGLLSAEAEGLADILFVSGKVIFRNRIMLSSRIWDTVSCDASTALDFDRKQRNKIVQKKKKETVSLNARRKGRRRKERRY